ncbi:mitochondrial 37S ribosomal protein rsm10 [Podila epicladia]|nr:mitochondrial 37S ribosomal protein rsm10 [Podila epicladia]KAG0096652.1 mitochondrial 37S ribosomal protein rsm10 [Podila epicladia]
MMLSPLKSTLSRNTLNAVKAASVATRSYSAQAKLPETMSPEDRLVYGEPVQIPTTHNITVAHLHLRSYLPQQLEFFADFARRAAAALEMPCSGVIPLPVQTSKWTVNKSPFVQKKAQETFERKTHKRLLAIKDTHPDVVRRWVQFLNQNSLAGVGMRVTVWENEELGVGQKRLEKVKKGESRNRSVAEMMSSQDAGDNAQEVSKDVKAVADQLLAEMMKDIGGQEEVAQDLKAKDSSSKKENSSQDTKKEPSSSKPVEIEDQPTESIVADVVEPLVSGAATLEPKLSEAVEKAVAETATKSDK